MNFLFHYSKFVNDCLSLSVYKHTKSMNIQHFDLPRQVKILLYLKYSLQILPNILYLDILLIADHHVINYFRVFSICTLNNFNPTSCKI